MSQSQEFIVRVPRETKKQYNVMRFNSDVDVTKWRSAKLERENSSKEVKGLPVEELPKFGAGSEFGRESREEARRKKYTSHRKNTKDPWTLKVNGRDGKRYKGLREGGVSDNTSYYVFFKAHDGAFEAFPVSEWYNFTPIPKYKALTAEEAEEQFEKRDKILNYFSVMATKKKQDNETGETSFEEKFNNKVKKEFKVSELDDWNYGSENERSDRSDLDNDDDVKDSKGKKGKNAKGKDKKKKKVTNKKKKKGSDSEAEDSEPLEESDEGDFDQREVDYMSDSSSSDEEVEEKLDKQLAGVADDLNLSDEDEEDEENEEKKDENLKDKSMDDIKKMTENDPKVKVKQEKDELKSESSAESEESDDSDFDDSKFQSAMFMQKKLGKSKNGSHADGKDKDDKHSKNSLKRKLNAIESISSPSSSSGPKKSKSEKGINITGGSSTSNSNIDGITEDAVRRYLMRKPMTTTELLQKFKSKKIPMSGSDFMTTITQILKKLNPEKQTIKGKLYLFIKAS